MKNKSKAAKKIEKKADEKDQISVSECRKILTRNGNQFSDDEVIEIRNFICRLADIFITHYQYDINPQGKIINLEEFKQSHYDESNYLRAG